MWTPLRTEISKICEQLKIPKQRFRPVSFHNWQVIQEEILKKFCNPSQIGWIWERLKGDTYAVQFNYNYPFDQLKSLIDHSEKVWLFLDETVSERSKYWLYEGYIQEIVAVLGETKQTDEVYVASKKYEWLLCINHHDYIIAAGSDMVKKLMAIENTT
jgi:hypothetical protein